MKELIQTLYIANDNSTNAPENAMKNTRTLEVEREISRSFI